ncbi:hypothetical protein ANRL3_00791 [Anaerolineae bacterium]|nr:hypothetical protein ANRL3_00791 [Anaerolineae bacterium]
MIDRDYLEKILKMNGSSTTAPDEEIRSVLISARWNKDDVESAITILRENTKTHQNRVERLDNVFLTDKRLSPEAIHALLGIKVEVDAGELSTIRMRQNMVYWAQIVSIFVIALIIALGSLLGVMYAQGVGVFHPTAPEMFGL